MKHGDNARKDLLQWGEESSKSFQIWVVIWHVGEKGSII